MKGCLISMAVCVSVFIVICILIFSMGWQPNGYGKDEIGEFIYDDSCIVERLDTVHRFTGKFWIQREVIVCDSSVQVKKYLD